MKGKMREMLGKYRGLCIDAIQDGWIYGNLAIKDRKNIIMQNNKSIKSPIMEETICEWTGYYEDIQFDVYNNPTKPQPLYEKDIVRIDEGLYVIMKIDNNFYLIDVVYERERILIHEKAKYNDNESLVLENSMIVGNLLERPSMVSWHKGNHYLIFKKIKPDYFNGIPILQIIEDNYNGINIEVTSNEITVFAYPFITYRFNYKNNDTLLNAFKAISNQLFVSIKGVFNRTLKVTHAYYCINTAITYDALDMKKIKKDNINSVFTTIDEETLSADNIINILHVNVDIRHKQIALFIKNENVDINNISTKTISYETVEQLKKGYIELLNRLMSATNDFNAQISIDVDRKNLIKQLEEMKINSEIIMIE